MAYQRVAPIYENEAIKTVALQLLDEIKVEAPEILEKWLTITLYELLDPVIKDYNELTEAMAFYKNISRGTVYSATIYTNSEGKIKTIPTEGYTYSQEIFYLVANGASVPNFHNFTCVWLNIVPQNTFVCNHATQIPGIRYYQQILNTSSQKTITLNNEQVVLNDNEALLYDPSKKFAVNTVDSNALHIGLVCDNLERTLEDCLTKNWQVI